MSYSTNQFNFEVVKDDGKYGNFTFSPLVGGFGHTLGNSLRRILLITTPGAAITKLKVKGVNHLFTTIPKVKEDMVEISLNLKKLRFQYTGEDPLVVKVSKKGPGVVTAADIKLPPQITIANPDEHIASLSAGADFEVELTISSGVGYLSAKGVTTPVVGEIPLDATFTPVTQVSYTVVPTRLGKKSDYDKLTLEVWTDGTITPTNALKNACRDFISTLSQIITPQAFDTQQLAQTISPPLYAEDELLIEEIELPLRVTNALKKAGYKKVSDLLAIGREKVSSAKNVGEKSLKLIDKWLAKRSLNWA